VVALKVAVAGVGSFAQRVLIPGLAASPEADLVALFGPTPDKTARVAQQHHVPRAYSSYEQMLDEARPEAVVVATPNDVHAPMALAAIRRGMAVLCEKPLAATLPEAEALAAAARAAGVPTAVNFTYRSTNSFRQVKRLLNEGRLGTLYHFVISFWQSIRTDPARPVDYRMLRERGGGALLDIGVHMMDTLRWFFGDLAAVCGQTHTAITERPSPSGPARVTADDVTSIVVRLAAGPSGTVQVSQVASGRQNYRRIELFGSGGSIVLEEDRTGDPVVRRADAGAPGYAVESLPADLAVAFDDFPAFHLTRIVRALRGDPGHWPTFEDGLAAQRAVAAVEESARTGRWVALR
jgi:predicted dehydrogenase